MSSIFLHRASWVVPVSAPVISDGCVVTKDNLIVAVGTFEELSNTFPDAIVHDHGHNVLTPALINAHIHLELSHLPIPQYKQEVEGFTDWIETLLSMREERGSYGKAVEEAARKAMQLQYQNGVIALGDIGNTDIGAKLDSEFPGKIIHFNECLGRTAKTRRTILKHIKAAPQNKIFTAHAPYSTHPELIQKIKLRAAVNKHPFPIHVAEPASENEMLCCGSGELYTFFKGRKFIDDSYKPPAGIDNQGSVQYLHDLGILDKQTICVHCIHVTAGEIEILAETGAKVCLCPGSNRYLRVGKAPVDMFLNNGILPALGTDSMASNPEISLWREMKILQEDYPKIDPANIFAMATLSGAVALGIDDIHGSLSPGKTGHFLSISFDEIITDETMLYNLLVQNSEMKLTWVNK